MTYILLMELRSNLEWCAETGRADDVLHRLLKIRKQIQILIVYQLDYVVMQYGYFSCQMIS